MGAGKSSKMIKKFDKKDEESGTRGASDAHPQPRGPLPLPAATCSRGLRTWGRGRRCAGGPELEPSPSSDPLLSSRGPAPSPSPGRRSLPSSRARAPGRSRAASGCSAAPPPAPSSGSVPRSHLLQFARAGLPTRVRPMAGGGGSECALARGGVGWGAGSARPTVGLGLTGLSVFVNFVVSVPCSLPGDLCFVHFRAGKPAPWYLARLILKHPKVSCILIAVFGPE